MLRRCSNRPQGNVALRSATSCHQTLCPFPSVMIKPRPWLAFTLPLLCVGCPTKSTSEAHDLMRKPAAAQKKHENLLKQKQMQGESSPTQTPLPPGFDDPPASAWLDAGSGDYAGLEFHQRGAPLDVAKTILIFFHGYGAEGDDLVPLSTVIQAGKQAAFLFAEAPVTLKRSGRAWFRRDRSNFEMGVDRARKFVETVATKYPNRRIIVGGFSQGAMLTLNLLETTNTPIQAAIIWSPADLLLTPLQGSKTETRVFLSHGRVDPVLPFSGSAHLQEELKSVGYSVDWVPFSGRHAIPSPVIKQLNLFLSRLGSE